MKILIIGTGNVAHFILHSLEKHKSSVDITIFGRQSDQVELLIERYNVNSIACISALVDGAFDMIILAIADNSIPTIFSDIYFEQTILVHCSGATSLDVMASYAKHKAVLWPIYSIRKELVHTLPDSIPLAVENESNNVRIQALAEKMSNNIIPVVYEQRLQLHLGATFVNNFTNHLYTLMQDYLSHNQLSIDFLKPIMMQQSLLIPTTNNFSENQTGAAIRSDWSTIRQHESLLTNDPKILSIYNLFTQSIIERHQL